MSTIFCCMGTRPEIIKMAPVVHALRHRRIPCAVVNSGQHEARVTDPLYAFFDLEVAHRLHPPRDLGGLTDLNAWLLTHYGRLFAAHRPSAVVVQGDTSSAWQAAQAAFFLGIPVAHVEAGLRTYDLRRPFPEELNRALIARVARWHFAPTQAAAAALAKESVLGGIEVVGNTVVDAALWGQARIAAQRPAGIDDRLEHLISSHRTLLVTAHRRENWGAGIRGIAQAVRAALFAVPDLACVWVLHPNPAVADDVRPILCDLPDAAAHRLRLIPPQNYGEMLWLMTRSWILLTDSGGIQEEAVTLSLPVLVTREETERPEVLHCGAGCLVGTDTQRILAALHTLRADEARYRAMRAPTENPFGDGRAAERIADHLADALFTKDDRRIRATASDHAA